MALSINLQGDDAPNDEEGEREEVGDSKGEAEEYAEDTAPVARVLAVFTTMYLRAQNICLVPMTVRMCPGARMTRDRHVNCVRSWKVGMIRPNAHEVSRGLQKHQARVKSHEPAAQILPLSLDLATMRGTLSTACGDLALPDLCRHDCRGPWCFGCAMIVSQRGRLPLSINA